LIDKNIFPRHKTCGDAIPGNTFKALNYLDPKIALQIRKASTKQEITKAAFFNYKGQKTTVNWSLYAHNLERSIFDNQLLEITKEIENITFFEGQKVLTVKNQNEQVSCILNSGLELTGKILIACDGANSSIKKSLFSATSFREDNSYFAVSRYYEGLEHLVKNQNEVYHVKKYPVGYFWIFPLGKGKANVGFGLLPNRKQPKHVNEAFSDIIENDPIISPLFKNAKPLNRTTGAKLPLGGTKSPMSGERFMLCGDAASLVDPISGAGMDTAIWSGIFAAECALNCFKKNEFNADIMGQYDSKIHAFLTKKLKRNLLALKLFAKYPRAIHFVLSISSWYQKRFANN